MFFVYLAIVSISLLVLATAGKRYIADTKPTTRFSTDLLENAKSVFAFTSSVCRKVKQNVRLSARSRRVKKLEQAKKRAKARTKVYRPRMYRDERNDVPFGAIVALCALLALGTIAPQLVAEAGTTPGVTADAAAVDAEALSYNDVENEQALVTLGASSLEAPEENVPEVMVETLNLEAEVVEVVEATTTVATTTAVAATTTVASTTRATTTAKPTTTTTVAATTTRATTTTAKPTTTTAKPTTTTTTTAKPTTTTTAATVGGWASVSQMEADIRAYAESFGLIYYPGLDAEMSPTCTVDSTYLWNSGTFKTYVRDAVSYRMGLTGTNYELFQIKFVPVSNGNYIAELYFG